MDVRVGAGAARSESESGKQGKRRGKKGRTAALVPRIKESVMERKKGEEGRGRERVFLSSSLYLSLFLCCSRTLDVRLLS